MKFLCVKLSVICFFSFGFKSFGSDRQDVKKAASSSDQKGGSNKKRKLTTSSSSAPLPSKEPKESSQSNVPPIDKKKSRRVSFKLPSESDATVKASSSSREPSLEERYRSLLGASSHSAYLSSLEGIAVSRKKSHSFRDLLLEHGLVKGSEGDHFLTDLYNIHKTPLLVRKLIQRDVLGVSSSSSSRRSKPTEFKKIVRDLRLIDSGDRQKARPASVLFAGMKCYSGVKDRFRAHSGLIFSPNVRVGGVFKYNVSSDQLGFDEDLPSSPTLLSTLRSPMLSRPGFSHLTRQPTVGYSDRCRDRLSREGNKHYANVFAFARKVRFSLAKDRQVISPEKERSRFVSFLIAEFNKTHGSAARLTRIPLEELGRLRLEYSCDDNLRVLKESLRTRADLFSYQQKKFSQYIDEYLEQKKSYETKCAKLRAEIEALVSGSCFSPEALKAWLDKKLVEERELSKTLGSLNIFDWAKGKIKGSTAYGYQASASACGINFQPEALATPLFADKLQAEKSAGGRSYYCKALESYNESDLSPYRDGERKEIIRKLAALESHYGDVFGVYLDVPDDSSGKASLNAFSLLHARVIGSELKRYSRSPVMYHTYDVESDQLIQLDEGKMDELLTKLLAIGEQIPRARSIDSSLAQDMMRRPLHYLRQASGE